MYVYVCIHVCICLSMYVCLYVCVYGPLAARDAVHYVCVDFFCLAVTVFEPDFGRQLPIQRGIQKLFIVSHTHIYVCVCVCMLYYDLLFEAPGFRVERTVVKTAFSALIYCFRTLCFEW